MSAQIKIAIAEDHDLLRNLLIEHLDEEDKFAVEIGVGNGRDLLDGLDEKPVDIILLDLDMPVMDGREALHIIRKKYGRLPKVIILSMHYNDLSIRKYLKSGANAYLPKGCNFDVLVECIQEVFENGVFFYDKVSPELMAEILLDASLPFRAVQGDHLTNMELTVLKLLCEGYTSDEIAEKVSRSPRTIECHRYRISQKTGIKNHMKLMEYAIINGIHSLNDNFEKGDGDVK